MVSTGQLFRDLSYLNEQAKQACLHIPLRPGMTRFGPLVGVKFDLLKCELSEFRSHTN
jgi:hypothetical protein